VVPWSIAATNSVNGAPLPDVSVALHAKRSKVPTW
jgi:hypothetical protein